MKAVVLDWGGVLALEPTEEARARVSALCGHAADGFEAVWAAHRLAYDCAELTAAEYWRRTGLGDDAALEAVLAADADAWSRPNLGLVGWPAELKAAGFRTGLLSNMPREIWERLGPAFEPWLAPCDELTLSFELGIGKPDERIYRHCLARLGVEPHEALFVDDRAENVEAARAVGMEAVRYTSVDALREELAERFAGRVPAPR